MRISRARYIGDYVARYFNLIPDISEDGILATCPGGSTKFTVRSSRPWRVLSKSSWTSVIPANGTKGISTANINVYPNVIVGVATTVQYLSYSANSFHYINGYYIMSNNGGVITFSTDLINFTNITVSPISAKLYDINYVNNLWVAVGNTGEILSSPDLVNWTSHRLNFGYTGSIQGVHYFNNKLVICGSDGIFTTNDLITFTRIHTSPIFSNFQVFNGYLTAGSSGGTLLYTSDLTTFNSKSIGVNSDIIRLNSVGDELLIGLVDYVAKTKDFLSYDKYYLGSSGIDIYTFTKIDGIYLFRPYTATSDYRHVYYSIDFENWGKREDFPSVNYATANIIYRNNTVYMIVGTIMYSFTIERGDYREGTVILTNGSRTIEIPISQLTCIGEHSEYYIKLAYDDESISENPLNFEIDSKGYNPGLGIGIGFTDGIPQQVKTNIPTTYNSDGIPIYPLTITYPSWITLYPPGLESMGMEDGTTFMIYKIDENTSGADRTGSIVIYAKDTSLMAPDMVMNILQTKQATYSIGGQILGIDTTLIGTGAHLAIYDANGNYLSDSRILQEDGSFEFTTKYPQGTYQFALFIQGHIVYTWTDLAGTSIFDSTTGLATATISDDFEMKIVVRTHALILTINVPTEQVNINNTIPITFITEAGIIDWGDGTIETVAATVTPTHTYSAVGNYTVKFRHTEAGSVSIWSEVSPATGWGNYITSILQWPTKLYAVKCYGFQKLTTIPNAPLPVASSHPTSLQYLFSYCHALTAVPEKLFYYNPKLSSISYVFMNARLSTIPEDLFINQTLATSATNTVSANYLKHIPAGLLRNTKVTSLSRFSYANTRLITSELELPLTVTSVQGTYLSCTALKTVRIRLTNVTTTYSDSLGHMFGGCTSLENVIVEGTIKATISFADSPLTYESFKNISNALVDLTGQTSQSISFSEYTANLLSVSDIQAITAKNWTVSLPISVTWEIVKLADGTEVKIEVKNHVDADFGIINPANGEYHFTWGASIAVAALNGRRLLTNAEHANNFALAKSTWVSGVSANGTVINGRNFTFNKPSGGAIDIFFPSAGYRNYVTDVLTNVGTEGYYWSSSTTGTYSYYLFFYSTNMYPSMTVNNAYNFSIKLIKNINITTYKINQSINLTPSITMPTLSRENIIRVINAFEDRSGKTALTLTIGSTLLALLTTEDILLATNKNITLA